MLASEMPKPEGALVQSNIRMPQWALDAFDAWAAEENEKAGYEKHSRSDLMRDALLDTLREREAARGEKKARKR